MRSYVLSGINAGWSGNHYCNVIAPLHTDHLSTEAIAGWSGNYHCNAIAPLHTDHLSIEATAGWSGNHHCNAIAPLHTDHLSIETLGILSHWWSLSTVFTVM